MNDANCFTISEAKDGAAAGHISLRCDSRTGCGSGVVIDGKPLIGRNAIAGEWDLIRYLGLSDEYPASLAIVEN